MRVELAAELGRPVREPVLADVRSWVIVIASRCYDVPVSESTITNQCPSGVGECRYCSSAP